MVQEVVLTTAGVILGIALLYYILLRLAQNDWMGDIPPGPTAFPVLGCLLVYLKIPEFTHAVEKYFILYGNIFTMKCWRQKIVYISGTENLQTAAKNHQIDSETIKNFCCIFRSMKFNLLSEEIVYLQNVWDANIIQMLKVREDDAALIRLITSKITEEDTKVAVENGLLTKSSSSKALLKCTSNANIIFEDELDPQVLEDLSELLQNRPLLWKNIFFKYLGGWRTNKIAKTKMEETLKSVQCYLETCLSILNIQTEKKFLLIIYILVKLSKLHPNAADKTVLRLGPDVCGWRIFTCQEYAEVLNYKIPKYSLIISKS